MPLSRGKDVLLTLDDGTGSFTPIGGLRVKEFTFNSSSIDVTNADHIGWRELLPQGGLKRAEISGNGVFVDVLGANRTQSLFLNGDHGIWGFVVPEFGRLVGAFQIVSLEYSGDYRGETAFSISLSSAGEIQFESSSS